MEHLPFEILQNILLNLNVKDIIYLALSNKELYQKIIFNNVLWKKVYKKTFTKFDEFECSNWYEEIKYIFTLKYEIFDILRAMPSRFYDKENSENIDYSIWIKLINEIPKNYAYVAYYLADIIKTQKTINSVEYEPSQIYGNKTIKYYSFKVHHFLRRQHFVKTWDCVIDLPQSKQLCENMLIIVAQTCQPWEFFSSRQISNHLLDLANNVLNLLYVKNNKHPIFETAQSNFKSWAVNNLSKSQWNSTDLIQIIDVLNLEMLNFKEIDQNLNTLEEYYIDKVLQQKRAPRVLVLLLKQAVGRRLGINFVAIIENYYTLNLVYNDNQDQYYNMDHIKIPKPNDPPDINTIALHFTRRLMFVAKNQFSLGLCDKNTRQHIKEILFIFCYTHASDSNGSLRASEGLNLINQAPSRVEPTESPSCVKFFFKEKNIRVRTPTLKYAVGMVMTQILSNYKCVIIDWEIKYNKFDRFKHKSGHPFYTVLLVDGITRYEPEEYLKPSDFSVELDNSIEIGKYFSHYFGNHYVPNAEKEMEYPEDKFIRMKYYRESWKMF